MPIEFRCSGCQKLLRTPDESAGKKARCPDCGSIVDVPATGGNAEAAPVPTSGSVFENPFADPRQAGSAASGGSSATTGGATGSSASGGAYGDRPGQSPSTWGDNPYAAPRTPVQDQPIAAGSGGPLEHRTVTLDELLKSTWYTFKPQFGMAILLSLVLFGLNSVASFVGAPINVGAQATREIAVVIIAQFVVQIINFIAQAWLQAGATLVGLKWARQGVIDISLIFAVGPVFVRSLGAMFLMNLVIWIPAMIGLSPAGVVLATSLPIQNEEQLLPTLITAVVGVLVAAPVMMFFAMKFFLTLPFIVDRNLGVIEAMKQSSAFMVGNKGTMFLATVVVGLGCGFAMICTCFLGILVVPAFYAVFVSIGYLLITGQIAPRLVEQTVAQPQFNARPPGA